METIKNYLETMFANMPNTPEVKKAKAELLSMMEDKFNEMIADGVNENQAVGTVIAEFGNLDELAEKYVFCGREIKNSVKDACVTAAINKKEIVCQQDLLNASEKTKIESAKVIKAEDHTKAINITEKQKNDLKDAMQKKINNSPDVIIPQIDEHNAEE